MNAEKYKLKPTRGMHLSQIVVGQNVSVLSGQLELFHSAFEIASGARFGGETL